jgi:hypothetical protein
VDDEACRKGSEIVCFEKALMVSLTRKNPLSPLLPIPSMLASTKANFAPSPYIQSFIFLSRTAAAAT